MSSNVSPAGPRRRNVTRQENAARAAELRGQGLLLRQIAERMGVAISTVHDWLSDPDGSRRQARKDSYRGRCVDCGAPTDGSNGRANAPKRCTECSHQRQHENAHWTPETVIRALQEFHRRYGRTPSAGDFNPAMARKLGHRRRAERYEADACWPSSWTVQVVCGSWRDAVAAAGLPSVSLGYDDELCRAIAVRYDAGEFIARLAAEYGCSERAIVYRARKGGARMRRATA